MLTHMGHTAGHVLSRIRCPRAIEIIAPLGRRQQQQQRQQQAIRRFSQTPTRSAEEVRIVEVGPRDGLQNEKKAISLDTKIELIRRLARTGVRDIEAGSFVSPKWVPQMANSAEVLNSLLGHPPPSNHAVAYNYLVPNIKGLQNFFTALDNATSTDTHTPACTPPATSSKSQEWPAPNTSTQNPNEMPSRTDADTQVSTPQNTTEISVFAAATEAFSKANLNCTIAESLERFRPILTQAKEKNIRVRGYVSVALGCPYEGPNTDPRKVAEVTSSLLEMGADEVSVADTTGMGTAPKTRELLKALAAAGIVNHDLALHFHDTYGQALVNTVVGLEHGIRTFDSSVGGLGGCPYSKGATGNVATEDLVYCLHSLGVKTGIDTQEMARTGAWISEQLGRSNDTRAGKAILARL